MHGMLNEDGWRQQDCQDKQETTLEDEEAICLLVRST